MFAIGDFARLGRVSVRMLRHYDQLGLLTPQHVDAATRYRYYAASQLPRLNRIVVLKDLGFTLRQIQQVLNEEVSAAELRGMLRLRRAELAAAITADETRLRAVEARLRVIDTEDTIGAPDVVVKRIPPARVAALWGLAASYAPDDVAPVIGPLFERLCQQLDEAAITPVGPAVAFYEHVDDGVRVHASLPVGGWATPPDPVELIDLPGITAATTIHCGSMSDSDAAIQDLARWVETHGYRSRGWAREVNLDTPSDESQWVTELQEPLVEPAEQQLPTHCLGGTLLSPYSPYVGSGPYCYSNSLSMMLGRDSPGADVIEVLTGAPFGYMLLGGTDPMFSPCGMEPDSGLDTATALLGYECRRRHANDATQAAQWLLQVTPDRPFLAGPMEMGLLRHQPDMTGPIGADHFVVVLGVEGDDVLFHDPHGYPYVTLPIDRFVAAWHADTVGYGTSFTARDTFVRRHDVTAEEALGASMPSALKWLRNEDTAELPPHTAAGARGLAATAELVAAGVSQSLRDHLTRFAISVGTRRLDDAARCLRRLDCRDAAAATLRHARLVGSLQTPMVRGEVKAAAEIFAQLARHYGLWCQAMAGAVSTLGRA